MAWWLCSAFQFCNQDTDLLSSAVVEADDAEAACALAAEEIEANDERGDVRESGVLCKMYACPIDPESVVELHAIHAYERVEK